MYTLIQNYKIISKIAEGGMGTVFYGEHTKLNRPVAIKQLHSNFTGNPDFRNRFVNEAIILARLNNPNIITIYDLIEEGGEFYIIMEYITGKTIDDILNTTRSPFQLNQCLYIFEKVLSAFQYAHNNGIIHRDIKPSNIILKDDDEPKILDFGIAKLINSNLSMTKTGTKMGSVMYMSPEQVMGREVTRMTDIYSLGIVLYEMLTNTLPYPFADSEYTIMENILKKNIPDLKLINSNIPSNVSNALIKATAKDPYQRFQSCEEFKNAIKNSEFEYVPSNTSQSFYGNTNSYSNTAAYTTNSNTGATRIDNSYSPYYAQPQNNGRSNKNLIILLSSVFVAIVAILLTYVLINREPDTVTVTNKKQTNENQTTPQTTNQFPPIQTQKQTEESSPVELVKSFINDLGRGDFQTAYEKHSNPNWQPYSHFSSSRTGFGGINRTEINECTLVYENSNDASVYIYYFSYDPVNKDGWYKQNFYLRKYGNDWKITSVKNISMQQWKGSR